MWGNSCKSGDLLVYFYDFKKAVANSTNGHAVRINMPGAAAFFRIEECLKGTL